MLNLSRYMYSYLFATTKVDKILNGSTL